MTTTNNLVSPTKEDEIPLSPGVFSIPEYLLKGEYSLDFTEEPEINYDFEIPFITPLRADRIGRMADWTGESAGAGGDRKGGRTGGDGEANGDEEGPWSSFFGEKNTPVGGQVAGPNGVRRNSRSGPSTGGRPSFTSARKSTYGFGGMGSKRIIREPSVNIESSWTLLDEVEFTPLAQLFFAPEDPQIVAKKGRLLQYDPVYDRVQARSERPLGILEHPSTKSPPLFIDSEMSDLIAKELALGNTVVVSSDVALSVLMASARTVIPWDIRFTQHPQFTGQKVLVIDKSEASDLDSVLVNECKPASADPSVSNDAEGKDKINSAANLAVEATRINVNLPYLLSQRSEPVTSEQGFHYVRWDLQDDLILLVRGSVNCSVAGKTGLLHALLEYDWGRASMDWRQRLDVQRSAVLASELKNNNAQIARWVCSAILSGVDLLKIAFVSRINPRDRTKHAILGVHQVEPGKFADQMGVNLANGFGIVKTLSLRFLNLETPSTLVVLRDPQKAMLRIYSI